MTTKTLLLYAIVREAGAVHHHRVYRVSQGGVESFSHQHQVLAGGSLSIWTETAMVRPYIRYHTNYAPGTNTKIIYVAPGDSVGLADIRRESRGVLL
jgi:hypothetical protein